MHKRHKSQANVNEIIKKHKLKMKNVSNQLRGTPRKCRVAVRHGAGTGRSLNLGAQSDIYECHKNAQVVTFTTCLVNINVFALPALNVLRI